MGKTRRETVIVNGRLALRAERLRAAREGAQGRQVLAVEHAAERLAGGFVKTVDMRTLRRAVSEAAPEVALGDLDTIKDLPGFPAAGASTLMKLWLSDAAEGDLGNHPRMQALARLDEAVTAKLPAHLLKPNEILKRATERSSRAAAVFGSVVFRGMTDLHPVWHPLLQHVSSVARIVWDAGPRQVPDWTAGTGAEILTRPAARRTAENTRAVSCSTPAHEAEEAVRWVRKLLAQGIPAGEIAVATCNVGRYEDHLRAADRASGIGFHYSRGFPSTWTEEGQAAAALADLVSEKGLEQARIRRLVEACIRHQRFADLPDDWGDLVPEGATLSRIEYWDAALSKPKAQPLKHAIGPVLKEIAAFGGKIEDAMRLAEMVLPPAALAVWEKAMADGPPAASNLTIGSVRVADRSDPSSSPCFMSAEEFAAAPRRHVWLLGLSSRDWPRRDREDPLLPSYVVDQRILRPLSPSEADRRDFATAWRAAEEVVMSWPRRGADGRLQAVSHLVRDHASESGLPFPDAGVDRLARCAPPSSPASLTELQAVRKDDFAESPQGSRASACWRAWHSRELTAYDGLVDAGDPAVKEAVAKAQSATSLRLMLSDPLGYVWKYCLGFSVPDTDDGLIGMSPRLFGSLLHETLRIAVDALDGPKGPGLGSADGQAVRFQVHKAAMTVKAKMETSQPVPPKLLWKGAVAKVEELAVDALTAYVPLEGQKSYAEVPFGGARDPSETRPRPWNCQQDVFIPGTRIRVQGVIDRLDFSGDGRVARVIDYKTGKESNHGLIDGGQEIQRPLYAVAVKALTEGVEQVSSSLHYVATGGIHENEEIDRAVSLVSEAALNAVAGLENGKAIPGPADLATREFIFAMPANYLQYLERKAVALEEARGPTADVWGVE